MALHIPQPGHGTPRSGPALCGRYATYPTGDQALIAYLARLSGDAGPYCAVCRRALADQPASILRATLEGKTR